MVAGTSRPTPPTCKTRNWPAYDEVLKRRGSRTIWFAPEMSWEAAPTGKREAGRDARGFWTGTVVLISKDENPTKSHARYVEACLIRGVVGNPR